MLSMCDRTKLLKANLCPTRYIMMLVSVVMSRKFPLSLDGAITVNFLGFKTLFCRCSDELSRLLHVHVKLPGCR
jgi:hypothetical protein